MVTLNFLQNDPMANKSSKVGGKHALLGAGQAGFRKTLAAWVTLSPRPVGLLKIEAFSFTERPEMEGRVHGPPEERRGRYSGQMVMVSNVERCPAAWICQSRCATERERICNASLS